VGRVGFVELRSVPLSVLLADTYFYLALLRIVPCISASFSDTLIYLLLLLIFFWGGGEGVMLEKKKLGRAVSNAGENVTGWGKPGAAAI
jgi:hypothetical protein